MSKFLLLLGPSGVGKSTIIEELQRIDKRFVYISPYITRSLRVGETNKNSISDRQMDEMEERGEFLIINRLFGIRYATPKLPIVKALAQNNFPVLDWPINRIEIMRRAFPGRLYVVYVSPPTIEVLQQRLSKDKRDANGMRLLKAREELQTFWSSNYSGMYDFEVVSEEGKVPELAKRIYSSYLNSVNYS